MSDNSPAPSAKPGTACLGCRRRKLKCSREADGCANCQKSDLPCVYPAPETGVKRKRGPYKKDKPPRERHLEDLVRYLEPKAARNNATSGFGSVGDGHSYSQITDYGNDGVESIPDSSVVSQDASRGNGKASNSEDLVKDALIALTKTSAPDQEPVGDSSVPTTAPIVLQTPNGAGTIGIHPPTRRILEYWHLFVVRVDPMLKIVHCPTFGKKLFASLDQISTLGTATETLLFSIYHAAIGTCTPREAREKFGESRATLRQRYARVIEATLADNYSIPAVESLQALVIYVIAIRRDDSTSNLRALFSLAVRMAQLIGLHEDPGDNYPPFEIEMRRRLWWHICGLESRGAEEGGARQSSIMTDRHVQLPANLNDVDLDPNLNERPEPRTGVTEMTYVLLRWECVRVVFNLVSIRLKHKSAQHDYDVSKVKMEQRAAFKEARKMLEVQYERHCHASRPYDWLCLLWIETMMTKARLMIDYPFGAVPTKEMPPQERFDLLQASVDIIRFAHSVIISDRIEDWKWYFRSWVQWHAVAIVIAELGGCRNQQFVNRAWEVLDPLLADWDKIYQSKQDEAAWDHVHALIERARQMRRQTAPQRQRNVTQSANQNAHQTLEQTVLQHPAPTQPTSYDTSQHYDVTGLSVPAYNGIDNASLNMAQHLAGMDYSDQQLGAPTSEIPFQTGNAAIMPDAAEFDGNFGLFGFDNIDFGAFDAVFGDNAWDFNSTPSTDFNIVS